MLQKVCVGEIKLPLQLKAQDLPVELPDKTPSRILPIPGPYVMTCLEIDNPDYDDAPEIVELPDETVDDVHPEIDNQRGLQDVDPDLSVGTEKETISMKPCSLVLRRLSDKDIALWKPKNKKHGLQEETELNIGLTNSDDLENTPGTSSTVTSTPVVLGTVTISSPLVNPPGPRMVSGYGLRNRPKPSPSGRAGPSRISKSKVSFDGLFNSEESSQDSRLFVSAEEDDHDETLKLIKITGLSEPSPYRIAAQRFIAAQKQGLLPPPLNQSLPGIKVKSSSSSSSSDDDRSDSTVIYDPPKAGPEKDPDYILPDETEHPKDDAIEDNKPKTKPPRKVVIGFKTYGIRKHKQPGYIAKNRKFKCPKCDKLFLTIKELNQHFLDNHQKLKCKDCDKTFQKPRSYKKHLYSHNVKPHKCTVCGKGFSFLSHLKTHKGTHNEPKRFKCSAKNCDRGYSTKSDLKKHERTHTRVVLKCSYKGCKYFTKDDRNLKSHLNNHSKKL